MLAEMRHTGPSLALLLVGLAGGTAVFGQAPVDGDAASTEEAPPVYIVEFLIFTYNEFNPYEEEFSPAVPHWPKRLIGATQEAAPETLPPASADQYLDDVLAPRPTASEAGTVPLPGTDTALPVVDESGNTLSAAPAPPDSGRWYRLLDAGELELNRAFSRLNTLDAYTPLVHAGWSQVTMPEDEALPFELALLGRLQPAGSIKLHRSRFLHLTVDISLQDDYRYRQAPLGADARWPLSEFLGPVRHHIDAQRRVRLGELHFFDHPAFGLLITVRPAPADPDAEGSPPTGPAA
jgi:hypothetical protein